MTLETKTTTPQVSEDLAVQTQSEITTFDRYITEQPNLENKILFANDTVTNVTVKGTGWLPQLPNVGKDYTIEHPEVIDMVERLGLENEIAHLPTQVDLSHWCSPIEDQLSLGSCTAHAAVGIVEYFQRKAFDKHMEGSRRFVYKTTRDLMKVHGDTGAFLRYTMGALALCGVPHEKYWPYTDTDPAFDLEPPAFVYAVADNFEALKYFSHDPLGAKTPTKQVLHSVKRFLAAGVPAMFGFYVFPSISQSAHTGEIPYPCHQEQAIAGHAIVAIGYDDQKEIVNHRCNSVTKGAFKIRNSWGISWGDQGYGWIPYKYLESGFASDFWSLLSMEWLDTDQFGISKIH